MMIIKNVVVVVDVAHQCPSGAEEGEKLPAAAAAAASASAQREGGRPAKSKRGLSINKKENN
jgi:hypothetical protein